MHDRNPRERAARALCHLSGNPEGTLYNGEPMWKSYLEEVDTVLRAALSEQDWDAMRRLDAGEGVDTGRYLAAPRFSKRSVLRP